VEDLGARPFDSTVWLRAWDVWLLGTRAAGSGGLMARDRLAARAKRRERRSARRAAQPRDRALPPIRGIRQRAHQLDDGANAVAGGEESITIRPFSRDATSIGRDTGCPSGSIRAGGRQPTESNPAAERDSHVL